MVPSSLRGYTSDSIRPRTAVRTPIHLHSGERSKIPAYLSRVGTMHQHAVRGGWMEHNEDLQWCLTWNHFKQVLTQSDTGCHCGSGFV